MPLLIVFATSGESTMKFSNIFEQSFKAVKLVNSSFSATGLPVKHDRVFWFIVKSDLSSVRYCTLHWTNNVLQGTKTSRPCLFGHIVCNGQGWV